MVMRTDVKHFQQKGSKYNGIYRGVVENNNDPDKLGRCKIRVWGIHDELKDETPEEGISTENLPWGEPALGLVEGSVSGYGMFSVPLQGSHVFCFFEGGNWEALRYFATAPGQPSEEPDPKKGFNDPNGEYPRPDRLNEPDIHRLARGQSEGTIVTYKDENLDEDVPMSTGETWSEPPSAYAAQYPKNTVITTHGGITIEIDSTPDAERLHIYHPSNTYLEIDSDGNLVFRNDADRFEITRGNKNTHVLVNDNETIDGVKTSHVKEDELIRIGGDQRTSIGSQRVEEVGTNETQNIGGNKEQTIGGDWTVKVAGNITLAADGNVKITGARVDLN